MPQYIAVKTWPSDNGKWTIQLNANDILSCNCPAWANWMSKKKGLPRICKHMVSVADQEGFSLEGRIQYYFVVNAAIQTAKAVLSHDQIFVLLVQDWDKALNVLASASPRDLHLYSDSVLLAKTKVEAYMLALEDVGIDSAARLKELRG